MTGDTLKKFYTEALELIKVVDDLSNNISTKSIKTNCDMGGNIGDFDYSIICTISWIAIKIKTNDCTLTYSVINDKDDNFTCCEFFNNEIYSLSEINFGSINDRNYFFVSEELGEHNIKSMDYPITDDQYFQYSTLLSLHNKDIYDFFISIQKDNPCTILISAENQNAINQFNELLTKNIIDSITDKINMIIYAYKITNGL